MTHGASFTILFYDSKNIKSFLCDPTVLISLIKILFLYL